MSDHSRLIRARHRHPSISKHTAGDQLLAALLPHSLPAKTGVTLNASSVIVRIWAAYYYGRLHVRFRTNSLHGADGVPPVAIAKPEMWDFTSLQTERRGQHTLHASANPDVLSSRACHTSR